MPDLSVPVQDGDPGHGLLHTDERTEINSLRARLATAESTISSQGSTLSQKYTLPAGYTSLSPEQQTLLSAAVVASVTTSRVSGAGTMLFKGADPGTNATPGVDLWIGEPAP